MRLDPLSAILQGCVDLFPFPSPLLPSYLTPLHPPPPSPPPLFALPTVSAYHITPPTSGECLISLDGEHLDLSAASSGDAAQKGLTVESLGPLGRTLTLEAEKGRWRAKETFVKAGGIEEALKM